MEYDKIKQLMEDMGNSVLTALDIEFPDGTKISMKKETTKVIEKNIEKTEAVEQPVMNISNQNNIKVSENVESKIIKSPMVGTFYLRPSPTADPYVEVGKVVSIGDTVCIIEAMKLMNEIEADVEGRIVEILANDGEPVEYGSPLFRVE